MTSYIHRVFSAIRIQIGRHMIRAIAVGTAISLVACTTTSVAKDTVRISAFKQGLISPSESGERRIYKEGNDFTYEVNGSCIANGQKIPCMWHGFEFTFDAPDDLNILTCTTESSRSHGVVDPTKSYGSNVTTFNWVLKLKGHQGYLINPQYTVMRHETSGTPFYSSTRCTYSDQEVLRFEFTVRVPSNQTI